MTQDTLRESTASGLSFLFLTGWTFFLMGAFVYHFDAMLSYYFDLHNTYPYPLVFVGTLVVEGAVLFIPYVVVKYSARFVVFNLSILEPPSSSKYESVEDVRELYSRGELDDEQMERRLGRAVEREEFGEG